MEEVQICTIHPCARQGRDNLDEIQRRYHVLLYHIFFYGEPNEAKKHRGVVYVGEGGGSVLENQNPLGVSFQIPHIRMIDL